MKLGNGFVGPLLSKGEAGARVVLPRGRCVAMAAAALLMGGAAGLAGALLWSRQQVEQSSRQASEALALAAMYLEDLVKVQDAVAVLPAETTAPAAASKEAKSKEGAGDGTRQEQTAAMSAADTGADQPAPQHLSPGGDNRKHPLVDVVRMTLEQAAIKTLSSAALTFRSGATFKVGERLPSGSLLLAVDAASGRIVTDRRIIALVDWPGATKTKTSAAVPPASPQGAAGASKETSLQNGLSDPSAPTPQPSAQAGDAVAAATRSAQASAQAPLSAAPAPEAAAAATAVQPSAMAPGAIEVVSAQQANIAALQSNGVRFMSGRFVAAGETFPSGEKLLRVLPTQGRIITDRRTIQIKEAQTHD